MVGEYIPQAPINDEAKKHNENLPNGGVYNAINLHVFNYGNNNPIKYNDPDGRMAEAAEAITNPSFWAGVGVIVGTIIEDIVTFGAGIADDPATLALGFTLIAGTYGIANYSNSKVESKSVPIAKNEAKTKEQVNVATATEKGVNGLTPIYRTGNGNGTNLTPRPVKDNEGLSYSLVKPAKGLYTMTTMEAVNATGVLFAFEDAPGHVSVNPIDASKMPEWQASRENANVAPHPYTKILQSISTKVKE